MHLQVDGVARAPEQVTCPQGRGSCQGPGGPHTPALPLPPVLPFVCIDLDRLPDLPEPFWKWEAGKKREEEKKEEKGGKKDVSVAREGPAQSP